MPRQKEGAEAGGNEPVPYIKNYPLNCVEKPAVLV